MTRPEAQPTPPAPRRIPLSLGRRLVLASLLVLPLYLLLTGFFLSSSFHGSQVAAAEQRLLGQLYALLGALEFDNGRPDPARRLREPRLLELHSGLYAWINDAQGELLWQSPSSDGLDPRVCARAMAAAQRLAPGRTRLSTTRTEPVLLRLQMPVIWEHEGGSEQGLLLTVAEEQRLVTAATSAFNRQLWLWLGGAAALLTLAQWLILLWGLGPLRRLTGDLGDLERGEHARLDGPYPPELQALADNLNRLLERERAQRSRYRNRLADLAHSLKTPLAVLRSETRPDAETLHQQLQRMDRIIDYQLRRAVGSPGQAVGGRQPLAPLLRELADTLRKVHAGRDLDIQVEVPGELQLAGDREDLLEVLGNLLDNACKAARSRVRVAAQRRGRLVDIDVDDDGPGVPAEQQRNILERGQRADIYGEGHGIGLAVVMDLVESHDGRLDISRSALGGARFRLGWPAAAD